MFHLGNKQIIFKKCLGKGYVIVPRRVYQLQVGNLKKKNTPMVFLAFYHGIHHRKFTTILVGIFSNNLLYLWLQILKLNLSGHFVAPDSLKQITTFSMKLWSPGDSPTPQEAIAAARCTVLICKDSWKLLEIAGGFWGEDLGPSQIWAWERLQLGLAASPIVIMVQWKMKGIYLKGAY